MKGSISVSRRVNVTIAPLSRSLRHAAAVDRRLVHVAGEEVDARAQPSLSSRLGDRARRGFGLHLQVQDLPRRALSPVQ